MCGASIWMRAWHFAADRAQAGSQVLHRWSAPLRRVFVLLTPFSQVVVLLGLVIAGAGAYSCYFEHHDTVTLSISQVESGARPSGGYLHLTGRYRVLAPGPGYTLNGSTVHYAPVVSPMGVQGPYSVFVQSSIPYDFRALRAPAPDLQGSVSFDGLPGPIRVQLADRHLLAPDYFVLNEGGSPEQERASAASAVRLGLWLVACAGLWSGLVAAVRRLRRRS